MNPTANQAEYIVHLNLQVYLNSICKIIKQPNDLQKHYQNKDHSDTRNEAELQKRHAQNMANNNKSKQSHVTITAIPMKSKSNKPYEEVVEI